ncbi:MAG: hypothetical protein LBF15_01035 [Candidatus Peribacteria bacterium]|nr:hypothetical protein [Candidatus Peribacteria bacterium]
MEKYSFTFDQYDEAKELIIHFPTTLTKHTFTTNFNTNNYNYHFEISKDGNSWKKIEDSLTNYDLDFLKVVFDNKNLKNTTIYEWSFYKN